MEAAPLDMTRGTFASKVRDTFRVFALDNYTDVRWSEISVCFAVYCLLLLVFPIEPPDDLLRHMTAYTYGYDYRKMFFASPGVPTFNMYYFFDVFAGAVHQTLGEVGAFLFIQVLATLIYGGALFYLTRGSSSRNMQFLLVMVGLTLVFGRITLARPATFESGLFLLALALCLDERAKWWWHLAVGSLMASFYYLFFIYFVPLVVIRRIYALPLVAGVCGWFLYGGNEYFRVISEILTMKSRRGLEISEATPIFYALLSVAFLLVPVLYYWRHNARRLAAASWFLLSNQLRYLEVIVPILVSVGRHCRIRVPQVVLFLFFISLCCTRGYTRPADSYAVLKGVVPAGSRVVFLDMEGMFKTLYGNDRLQVSPCMDPGWDSRALVQAMKAADSTGALDRRVLSSAPYDYLIEKNLRSFPEGLELVGIAGKYRIWKIPPQLHPSGASEKERAA